MSRFNEFWDVYPRRVAKKPALAVWRRMKLDQHADRIIADVRARCAADSQWRESKQLIPKPTTYLEEERWTDEWIPNEPRGRHRLSAVDRVRAAAQERHGLDAGDDFTRCKAAAQRLGLPDFAGAAGEGGRPPETVGQFVARVTEAMRATERGTMQ